MDVTKEQAVLNKVEAINAAGDKVERVVIIGCIVSAMALIYLTSFALGASIGDTGITWLSMYIVLFVGIIVLELTIIFMTLNRVDALKKLAIEVVQPSSD